MRPFKKKIGQMSRSKGYVPTEKTYHREYRYSCEISNFSTHYSNVINKGIVFKKGPKSILKKVGIQGKVLNHGILMLDITALALPVQLIVYMIDLIVFYAISAIFQPYNGGSLFKSF